MNYYVVIKSNGTKYYMYDVPHQEIYVPPFENVNELENHIETLFYNIKKDESLVSVKSVHGEILIAHFG